MADRRYKTARWQRLRRAVLVHFNYTCQLRGPRCTGRATTVHHLVPSSQAPELFFEPTNLTASCARCNYSDGSRVASQNKRETIAQLCALVEEQEQRIAHLLERLARYEDGQGRPVKRPAPAIH